MNSKLLLKNSLRIMSRNKPRTFFMSIGVAVGVATHIGLALRWNQKVTHVLTTSNEAEQRYND